MAGLTVSFEMNGIPEMRGGVIIWQRDVMQAVEEIGQLLARKLESYADHNARWNDVTGAARKGLKGDYQWETVVSSTEYAIAGRIMAIYLTHGYEPDIWYGVFLELGHGQKYAIIMPTIYSFFPEIEALLQGIFSG
jgi:hypothetical protein